MGEGQRVVTAWWLPAALGPLLIATRDAEFELGSDKPIGSDDVPIVRPIPLESRHQRIVDLMAEMSHFLGSRRPLDDESMAWIRRALDLVQSGECRMEIIAFRVAAKAVVEGRGVLASVERMAAILRRNLSRAKLDAFPRPIQGSELTSTAPRR